MPSSFCSGEACPPQRQVNIGICMIYIYIYILYGYLDVFSERFPIKRRDVGITW